MSFNINDAAETKILLIHKVLSIIVSNPEESAGVDCRHFGVSPTVKMLTDDTDSLVIIHRWCCLWFNFKTKYSRAIERQ